MMDNALMEVDLDLQQCAAIAAHSEPPDGARAILAAHVAASQASCA